ncbi:helix-turn-helix domain-containing protein [Gottfriedia luciferensis]|uniref:helix-turn-helix domain-containing protein n=1 Tax=Gottfriedia luciferensis TaxID=178774 RepID=UPI000B447749|nr:helix-turn-helix domain-containing protein [Gottfriedia luciferensis]
MIKLSVLEEIILYLIHRYNGERTIQGITHLLRGKQSAQIIQDSHFYRVTSFFGLFQFLTQQNMSDLVYRLEKNGYIIQYENNNTYLINSNGIKYLENVDLQFNEYTYLNGLRFNSIQKVFWKRFTLFFQTISNLNMNVKYFRAVIQDQDTQEWVKKELLSYKGSKNILVNHFYEELHKILKQLSDDDALLFVNRLSGANSYGMTLEQIASENKINVETTYIKSINVLHHILFILIENKNDFPFLSRFVQGDKNANITNTSIETKRLFTEGKSIQDIAHIRKLKISTIEDHIVECVISDKRFPIDQFITNEQYTMIKNKILELNTRKLKIIKEALLNEVSYFQIRITLARMGDIHGPK